MIALNMNLDWSYLVWTLGREVRWLQKIHATVSFRNICSDREQGLEK